MIRLNKYLSQAGICSRREADKLIEQGKVTIDGVVAQKGMSVGEHQEVKVGKKVIGGKEKKVILLVNKPVGIVCTEDMREKKNIIRYLNYTKRVTYAGRLDKDSQGLLIMTNDGELIQAMMRAKNMHEKEYKVTVDKEITGEFLKAMEAGVRIKKKEKGKIVLDETTRPCKIKKLGTYTFSIILTQGLNRQIRRMCETLGYKVKILKRVRIMNLELGNIKEGTYREITEYEQQELETLLQLKR